MTGQGCAHYQLLVVLVRRYTQAGLKGINSLKNRDRAVAAILHSLAAAGYIHVYLGFIKRHESGPAEGCPGEEVLYEVDEAENEAHGLLNLNGSRAVGLGTLRFELDAILNPEVRLVGKLRCCGLPFCVHPCSIVLLPD